MSEDKTLYRELTGNAEIDTLPRVEWLQWIARTQPALREAAVHEMDELGATLTEEEQAERFAGYGRGGEE